MKYGKALVEADRRPGPVPVFGTNGQCGIHNEALFRGPGVILGRKGQGPLGVEWCSADFWVIDTAYALSPLRSDIEIKYAYFLLKHIGLNHLKDGTSNPTLSRDSFGAQALPLPPIAQQRAIAHILGTLDDKIELNRKTNETLESMARALFKSWFVDFEPVRAKAEGRDTGLPRLVADLFPDSFEDSELGEIPNGWRVASILEQASLLSGGTPKTERREYWSGGIPWASAKDVSQCQNMFLAETERTISELGLSESATQMIPEFATVVVARGATTGRMTIFGKAMAMNQTCYALVSTTATPFAFYCTLRREIGTLIHAAHGSVFDTITSSTFVNSKSIMAPANLLSAFEVAAAPLFLRLLKGVEESRTLSALRDTLLPRLISGELRVKDAEKFIGEVS